MKIASLPVLTTALAASLGAGAVPYAHAQSTGVQQQPEQSQPQAHFSKKDMKSFAVASLDIQRIDQTYRPKMAAAKTPDEQQKVRQEALGKMTQALKDNGLTVKKYNDIATAAQRDPGVASQLRQYIQQAK